MSSLISTSSTTPCRRLAVTALALPMAFMLSGTALAAGPAGDLQLDQKSVEQGSSAADLSIEVGCFTVSVLSDKDISNVKVTFADGGFQEINGLSGFTFNRTFEREIASATAKSGTTSEGDTAGTCSTETETETEPETEPEPEDEVQAPVEEPVEQTTPVQTPVEEVVPVNGTANISIEVGCFTVSVVSDKDISNVKVTFADGDFQEIEGLSGFTFERTFDKEIVSATAKSATTSVGDDAGECATDQAPVQDVLSARAAPTGPAPAHRAARRGGRAAGGGGGAGQRHREHLHRGRLLHRERRLRQGHLEREGDLRRR